MSVLLQGIEGCKAGTGKGCLTELDEVWGSKSPEDEMPSVAKGVKA